ncbi:MAG: short-chain dehydrogenase, partial [Flavobacteriaceae bacterium]
RTSETESDRTKMEHQKDNIDVTIICPGFVRTPIAMNSLRGDGSVLGVDDLATRKGMQVEDFARKMVRSVDQKKWEVSFGGKERLGVSLKKLSNKLLHSIVIRSKVR